MDLMPEGTEAVLKSPQLNTLRKQSQTPINQIQYNKALKPTQFETYLS